ncbi:MAG: hypothetical protein JWM93_2331 [Frankiales bacterium]|nr:hypothetical protein [Frankiales bacterium]
MPGLLRRGAVALALVLAVLVSQSLLVRGVGAAFVAIMKGSASSWAAAASFPSYASTVLADSPSIVYRADDAVSTSTSSSATDSSGNSRTGTYDGPTNGPSQWWRFDQASGTTVVDRSGGGFKGTLSSGVSWAPGKYGSGVNFPSANLATNVVTSTQLPIRTSQSFSVAAWVNIADTAGVRTAVSAGTTGAFSGFILKYDTGWRFSMPYTSNTANGSMDQIVASAGSPVGQWVHLVGVYNAATYQMTLYVNGASAATGTRTTGSGATNWDATGGLTLGQSRYSYNNAGIAADPWTGTIDDVRLYNRALSASDVSTVYAGTDTPPVADWRFDDGDDNAVATDASGNGNTLSLTNVPATPNSRDPGANSTARSLVLSGSSYGTAPRPVVRTDQSFTVSAWVRNTDPTTSNWRRIVTEPGAHSSAFTLEYRGDAENIFGFSMANGDIDGPTWTNVYSTTKPVVNSWYHVVGVYDAAAGVIRIYVNGTQEGGDVARAAPGWTASGATQVGRGISNSVMDTTTEWVGDIDEVELYQRALTSAEVSTLRTSAYPVGSSAAGQIGATGPSGSVGSAVAFNGTANAYYGTSYTAANVPTTNFSQECWFRTDSAVGGALMGFAAPNAGQGSTNDKMVYLNSAGAIVYGVNTGTRVTVSTPSSYNDGNWHHVVVTQSSTAGATIYVDGASVASSSSITSGQAIAEYWRWGGQSLAYWPGRPASDFFVGTLDEVALYPTVLTPTQVQLHYYARAR